jgi:hypothetical protein
VKSLKLNHEIFLMLKMKIISQVPVAHTCDPSYSGGRDQDQKDCGMKPAQENSLHDPISKNRDGGVSQGVDPDFKFQY